MCSFLTHQFCSRQWEAKVERSQEEFERISRSIKKEMEMFDCNRVKDFKDCIVKYLETLMANQQKVGRCVQAVLLCRVS